MHSKRKDQDQTTKPTWTENWKRLCAIRPDNKHLIIMRVRVRVSMFVLCYIRNGMLHTQTNKPNAMRTSNGEATGTDDGQDEWEVRVHIIYIPQYSYYICYTYAWIKSILDILGLGPAQHSLSFGRMPLAWRSATYRCTIHNQIYNGMPRLTIYAFSLPSIFTWATFNGVFTE